MINVYGKKIEVDINYRDIVICWEKYTNIEEFENCVVDKINDILTYSFSRIGFMRRLRETDYDKYKDILTRYSSKMRELIRKWLRSASIEVYTYAKKET